MKKNEMSFKFDLQLFGEDAANGAESNNMENPQTDADNQGSQAQDSQAQATAGNGAAGGGETLLGAAKETAVEYDFKSIVPEGMEYDEKQAEAFASIAKDLKLSGEQASKLAAYGMNYAGQMTGLMQQAKADEVARWAEESRKELGIDFDSTMQKAGAGLEALEKAIPNIRQALQYTGAGNRIEFIRAMAFVGELTKEDSFRGFGANSGAVRSSLYGNTNFGLY